MTCCNIAVLQNLQLYQFKVVHPLMTAAPTDTIVLFEIATTTVTITTVTTPQRQSAVTWRQFHPSERSRKTLYTM